MHIYNSGRNTRRKPFENRRSTVEDTIKMIVKETRWKGADWINLIQDMDHSYGHGIPQKKGNFQTRLLTSLEDHLSIELCR
jgi:hypothetical protein